MQGFISTPAPYSPELAKKLEALETKLSPHDQAITGLINAIRQFTAPPMTTRRKIGFVIDNE